MADDKGLKDSTLSRLENDDRYKRVLSSVDEQTRGRIDTFVKDFISQLSDGLSKLDDPEVKRRLLEILKR